MNSRKMLFCCTSPVRSPLIMLSSLLTLLAFYRSPEEGAKNGRAAKRLAAKNHLLRYDSCFSHFSGYNDSLVGIQSKFQIAGRQ